MAIFTKIEKQNFNILRELLKKTPNSQNNPEGGNKEICRKNWISTHRRMKLDPYLMLYIKMDSKWIKKLKIRPKTMKLPEKSRRKFVTLIWTMTFCI
jgi:alpha-galactosidase/6-phospho-beta-glucosidase family protein